MATPDKLVERTWYQLAKDLITPALIGGVGLYLGWVQFEISNKREDTSNAESYRAAQELILTEYFKSVLELLTNDTLWNESEASGNVGRGSNMVRGQTLVALHRLNTDKESRKLKGLLLRFLYDNRMIGYDLLDNKGPQEGVVDLYQTDIRGVSLRDAWLPGLQLPKTWLNDSDFSNADLRRAQLYQSSLLGADFSGAELTGVNFMSADLRGANFSSSKNIDDAKFDNACYVAGDENRKFPSGFSPSDHKMVPMNAAVSDRTNLQTFERCAFVFFAPTP